MKKIVYILVFASVLLACTEDNDDNIKANNNVSATFNFSHEWDGTPVTNANFNTIQYTNANGEEMSVEKLRYLISKITLTHINGTEYVIDGYNLVDVTAGSNMVFEPDFQLPKGGYSNVKFTFGFNNTDNYDTNYPDLNSASWNVPDMLGGGYHFMQLEGRFINSSAAEMGYAYHAIRAVDTSNAPDLLFQDTFFEVDLGGIVVSNTINIEIKMNIAEWFKNPNQWDLNILNNMMMPNFNAQVMIHDNVQGVFSLGTVTQ